MTDMEKIELIRREIRKFLPDNLADLLLRSICRVIALGYVEKQDRYEEPIGID